MAAAAVEPDVKVVAGAVAPDVKVVAVAEDEALQQQQHGHAALLEIPVENPQKRVPITRRRKRAIRARDEEKDDDDDEKGDNAPDELMFTAEEDVTWCAYQEPANKEHSVYRGLNANSPNVSVCIYRVTT